MVVRVAICRAYIPAMSAVRLSEGLRREGHCVRSALFHPFSRDRPNPSVKDDIGPAGRSGFHWASHGMQLPIDQGAGGALDADVSQRHHQFGELIRAQGCHILPFRLLEDSADFAERVGMYQA